MAYFNEENTVEQMLINAAGKCGWIYVEPQEVPRLPDEVLVTEWLLTALKKFNDITDDQAAQVIYRLRAACSIGNNHEELIMPMTVFAACCLKKTPILLVRMVRTLTFVFLATNLQRTVV